MAVASPPRSNSPNSKTTSHLRSEMGLLQDEMKRPQRRTNEKLSDDMSESKKEVFDKLSREIGPKIKNDVNDQCDPKSHSPEWKRLKTQHPGGTSEDILNHVLKTPGDAFSHATALEATIHRMEMTVQMMDSIHVQVSALEDKIQKLIDEKRLFHRDPETAT